jgi:hypothetical protein
MPTIGFSTGAVAYGDFMRAISLLYKTRAKAIELSALRQIELPELLSALPNIIGGLRDRYDYVSFHAPTDFEDEGGVVFQLKAVAELKINIVVHPDTIREPAKWRELGSQICIENMDSRKQSGRTVGELRAFFEQIPNAKLCFDIAHARQVDSTMVESMRILEEFSDRLVEVHLSEINSLGKHFAMSFAAKRAYQPFAEILASVPVILESVVTYDEVAPEIAAAEHLLGRNGRPIGGMRADYKSVDRLAAH